MTSSTNSNLPEFNIEQALKGHPVQLRGGEAAIIVLMYKMVFGKH